jgi:hypothetical protein
MRAFGFAGLDPFEEPEGDPLLASRWSTFTLRFRTVAARALPLYADRLPGDRLGQTEALQCLRGDERRDLFDLAFPQGEDVEAVRHERLGLLVPEVARQRGLSVRRCRNQLPAFDIGERISAQEDGDLVAAAVPAWQRRHRHPGVLCEHGDDSVDVVSLPGGDVALDELAQLVVAEQSKRLLLGLARQPFVHGLMRSLQGAVDGDRGRFEYFGGLSGREAEDVTEDEHGPLACGQVLQRGDEGELDSFALLVAGVRAGWALKAEVRVRYGSSQTGSLTGSASRSCGSAAGA